MLLDVPRQHAEPIGIWQFKNPQLPGGMLTKDGISHRAVQLLIPRRLHADRMEIKFRRFGFVKKRGGVGIDFLIFER